MTIPEMQRAEDGGQRTDSELLRAYAADGAQDAFATLVRRHLNLVYGAALRRTGNAALAQEVAQEVFTSVARKAASLAERATLTGWLFTATRFAAAQKMRAEQARQRRERESQLMETLNADATREWERLRPVIDEALEHLSASDREAVLLRFFEGEAFGTIGATLRISEDAARMRVDRALDKLRGLLARRGVTSTTVALATVLPAVGSTTAPATLAGAIANAALAATTASGGTLAGAGLFMGMTKTTIGAAALAVVVAMGVAVNEVQSRQAAEALLAEMTRGNARSRAAPQRAPSRVVVAASNSPAAPAATAKEAVDPELAEREKQGEAIKAKAEETGRAMLERYPEVKAAFERWRIAKVDSMWRPFYHERGLTEAQIDRFRALKPEPTFSEEMGTNGATEWAVTLSARPDLTLAQTEKALRELLGDEGYRSHLDYERTREMQSVAYRVARTLAFSDTPLQPAQAVQLRRILERHATEVSEVHPPRFDWDAVAAEARGILAEPRIAALNVVREEARAREARARQQAEAATATR